jgi:hypothetical protein
MQTINNLATGTCLACSSNCATCSTSSTYCTTCPTGSTLVALKCLSTQNVGFNMTFSSPTATSTASELQAFMVVVEEIRASIAGNLGTPYNTNPSLISFASVLSGSIQVGGNIDTSQSTPSATYTAMSSIQPSGGYSGFSMHSSSYVANGFNPSTSPSSVNLPLVLGITIPVVILFVVVGVIIIVKLRHKGNAIKEVEKVEQLQVGQPVDKVEENTYNQMEQNDTANNLRPELKKEMHSTNNEAFS